MLAPGEAICHPTQNDVKASRSSVTTYQELELDMTVSIKH